jgi:predicted nucleotide-binding protein (sugar kinase/HSP70/actin superfamily)
VDADCTPPSDERTLELGARYTTGDECYPAKVTLGDFLKILEQPGTDPRKTVFFMASASGPCRFGQYAPFLEKVLAGLGYSEVKVLSPQDVGGYADLSELGGSFVRTGWRALVVGDILLKRLLRTRPYEVEPGSADKIFRESVDELCQTLEVPYGSADEQLQALQASLLRARDRFRRLPVRPDRERPLVGVVGEIFCRLNTFSNEELVRRLEEYGAEAWMSDIAEWVWYTNAEQLRRLRVEGRYFSWTTLKAKLRTRVQKEDEHKLVSLFAEDFRGLEELEDINAVLQYAEPYLPRWGAMGEMVLNIGRAVYLAKKGVDAILDISPFTCMNGIVCEAIYPRLSSDLGGIPIRNFYFDGTQSDLDRDIGIYVELARSYRARKRFPGDVPSPCPTHLDA